MEQSPDKVLADLRGLVAKAQSRSVSGVAVTQRVLGMLEFAELFDQLDKWLSQNGSRPAAWASRGVDLDLPDTATDIYLEIDVVRAMLESHPGPLVLKSGQPQLIVATTNLGVGGTKDMVVAALASHAAFSHDPAKAVRLLGEKLANTLNSTGKA